MPLVNVFSANTSHMQIQVTGYKLVESLDSNKIKVYSDGKHGFIRINGTYTTTSWTTVATTNYKPLEICRVFTTMNSNWVETLHVNTNGVIQFMDNVSNLSVTTSIFYVLATPLY